MNLELDRLRSPVSSLPLEHPLSSEETSARRSWVSSDLTFVWNRLILTRLGSTNIWSSFRYHIESPFRCEPKCSAFLLKWGWHTAFLILFRSLAVQDKLDQMVFIWENIHTLVEEREAKLLDVMELAEKFWCDHMSLVVTTKDTQDFIRDLEDPGIDPSVVKQQQEAAEVSRVSHLKWRNKLLYVVKWIALVNIQNDSTEIYIWFWKWKA